MKHLLIILSVLFSINAFGQFGKSVQLMGEGPIEGNESILLKSKRMSQTNGFIGIQVVVDTVSISSGTGYLIPKASLFDFSNHWEWATLTTIEGSVYTSQNDTLTVTTRNSYLWGITVLPWDYVGVYISGAVGDTFNYKVYYVGKEF